MDIRDYHSDNNHHHYFFNEQQGKVQSDIKTYMVWKNWGGVLFSIAETLGSCSSAIL